MNNKIVVALGLFDGIHKGHVSLLSKTIELARQLGAEPAVFTFSNDFFDCFSNKQHYIYNEHEKMILLKELGFKNVIVPKDINSVLELSGETFFYWLIKQYNVLGLLTGSDFKFGKDAKYNTKDLKELSEKNGITYLKVSDVLFNKNKKISSSLIKDLLKVGKIDRVNELLNKPYFMLSTVVKGRGEGHAMGVNTANFKVDPKRVSLKPGVYITKTTINDQKYKSVTHIGKCLTFGICENSIETAILDFFDNIYSQEIKVEFYKYIRETKDFSQKQGLYKQIQNDILETKLFYKNFSNIGD